MTQRVVSIVGPTASGKTGLGIAIARRLAEAGERAEIVNADAYQMYRGMDIGTAKPTAEEQAAVPHHLIDIIDPEEHDERGPNIQAAAVGGKHACREQKRVARQKREEHQARFNEHDKEQRRIDHTAPSEIIQPAMAPRGSESKFKKN